MMLLMILYFELLSWLKILILICILILGMVLDLSGNKTGKTVIIFGVDNGSSVHVSNNKKDILLLDKGSKQELSWL